MISTDTSSDKVQLELCEVEVYESCAAETTTTSVETTTTPTHEPTTSTSTPEPTTTTTTPTPCPPFAEEAASGGERPATDSFAPTYSFRIAKNRSQH
jgi:hypothetical protein